MQTAKWGLQLEEAQHVGAISDSLTAAIRTVLPAPSTRWCPRSPSTTGEKGGGVIAGQQHLVRGDDRDFVPAGTFHS